MESGKEQGSTHVSDRVGSLLSFQAIFRSHSRIIMTLSGSASFSHMEVRPPNISVHIC